MKVVIPTAGFGTRLRPHTWSKPKPLVSVAGKPVLGHVIDLFSDLPNIDEVIFIVGYLGEQIEAYIRETYPHLKTRFVEQKQLIGQSHAIWLAREGLAGPMLMAFVDTIIETDLRQLANEPAQAVAWVKEVPDPRRFGVADVSSDGWVKNLVEKPDDMRNNLAVVGFYYFQQAERLIEAIALQMERDTQLKGEFYLADAINILLDDGLKMRVEPVDVWVDCGKPEALLETNRYLLSHGRDNTAEAQSRADTLIIPPVYINPSAKIEHAVLGPYVSIGANCIVDNAIISDSILEDRSRVESIVLRGSLLGRDVHVQSQPHALNLGDNAQMDVR